MQLIHLEVKDFFGRNFFLLQFLNHWTSNKYSERNFLYHFQKIQSRDT